MITVDDREPYAMNEILEAKGLEFEKKRLLVGDYIKDDICIERKTIDDFCASIMDGRLDRQMGNMKRDFKHCYVLISGSIKSRKSDIAVNSILGKMSSVVTKHNIPIICVDDDDQLIYLVGRLFKRHEEMKEEENEEVLS